MEGGVPPPLGWDHFVITAKHKPAPGRGAVVLHVLVIASGPCLYVVVSMPAMVPLLVVVARSLWCPCLTLSLALVCRGAPSFITPS